MLKFCMFLYKNAENLDKEMVYNRLIQLNPKLICFVVYGQNVNAGTSNMEGATSLSNYIKEKNNHVIINFLNNYNFGIIDIWIYK